jgi:hypothetical protein
MSYRLVTAAALAAFLSSPLYGQESGVPTTRLTQPDVVFPEPFSALAGIRELSDGRLILSDRLERAVRILDLDAGTFEEIGHAGSGPGEYQMPGELLPLPGDSTLLVDFGNIRMTVIDPSGRFGASTSLMQEGIGFVNPSAIDSQGRVYFEASAYSQMGEAPPDSMPIVRWDPASDRTDTVGMVPVPEMATVSMSSGSGGSYTGGGIRPFEPRDDWDATPSGSVGIARSSEYRVDWHDGTRRSSGTVVSYTPVPVTRRDKEAWAERMGQGQAVMISSGGQGSGYRSMRLPTPDIDAMEWPETKPAFQPSGVHASPEGELWVQRYVRAGAPVTFDVFDGQGRRTRQVILPADRRFLGFGDSVLYLIRVDEDDLQWLERYRR